jgi:signal transduction histidine kinase
MKTSELKSGLEELNITKQELSCISVIPVLQYLEDLFGKERMVQIIESLGLPISFLTNKSNWLSYDYYNNLLDKLVEVTGDAKAPYKAAFSVKPEKLIDYVLYATYTTFWSQSPKLMFTISMGSNIYKRFTKIGIFTILSANKNSLTIQLKLKEGYKQTKNNCLAIQGLMAFAPIGMGLPPAELTELQCTTEGSDSCIYEIKWKKKTNWLSNIITILFFVILGLQLFVFQNIITSKDIILTFLTFLTFNLGLKGFHFWKNIRFQEKVNEERTRYLTNTLEKTEKDYKELLEVKIKLEERTTYLSIVNQVINSIARATEFNQLLIDIIQILINRLGFEKGNFFQYNFEKQHYYSLANEQDIIPKHLFDQLKEKGRYFVKENIPPDLSALLFSKHESGQQSGIIFSVPFEIADIYAGFFYFFTCTELVLAKEVVDSLLENVIRQLKIGFQKIASRMEITNILSSIPTHVLIFDKKTMAIKYVNSFFLSHSPGLNQKDDYSIIDNYIFDIIPFNQESQENIISKLKTLEIKKETEKFETSFNSMVFEYSLFSIPHYLEEDRLAGLIMTDITEARSYQQKLLINEKLLALGRVASGIAHEINNPLYAVLANAEEIAEDTQLSKQSKQYAEEIIEHVMNVSSIIKDLSMYSKTLRKEEHDEVDLNTVIAESLKLVKYSSNYLEVEVKTNLAPLPTFKAAKGEMQQVCINLFNNAIQAMDGKGILTINSSFKNNAIEISVVDTGIGIPEANMPQIFKLFFTTKEPGKGTGQGLHIVKKIVDLYKGSIRVESKVGVGTTFFITFPIYSQTRSY